MKINDARISILVQREYTEIVLHDNDANIEFARVTLTPAQLSEALSRVVYTHCECEVIGLDKVGKLHECKAFEFEIPEVLHKDYNTRSGFPTHQRALKALKASGMEDWIPDNYYNSQGSFFTRDGKFYAKVTIRRWVNKE